MIPEPRKHATRVVPPAPAYRNGFASALLLFVAAVISGCGAAPVVQSGASDTPAAPAATADVGDYRISPEDVLAVSVWGEEDLTREVTVRPDGGFSFPLIGDTRAAGMTASDLAARLGESLSEFIPDAEVNVAVKQIKGLKVFVTGQVKKPGQYLVGRYVDVLQALTLAGGLTPFADRRNVRILRRTDAGEQIFNFDYQRVQRGQSLEQNIILLPGDTVIVP